ncbi:GFA family protein [Dyella telluris]|uniref:GFA family protein n=1 Tax=Dyella telluris TaxID=2763498 RepID=UPI001EE57ACF|nr:GFA family protein [Dyella telluris]
MTKAETIRGSCRCGAVQWHLKRMPESATVCNCTACHRYGALWAYDFEGDGIQVLGPTRTYTQGRWVEFHFCSVCGCVAYWRGLKDSENGRRPMGVNLRMADLDSVAQIPIVRHNGLTATEDLPQDGRCVTDYWF